MIEIIKIDWLSVPRGKILGVITFRYSNYTFSGFKIIAGKYGPFVGTKDSREGVIVTLPKVSLNKLNRMVVESLTALTSIKKETLPPPPPIEEEEDPEKRHLLWKKNAFPSHR